MSQLASPIPSQLGGLTWQKLILGDWSRVVRDPLDVCRLLFLLATIVWAVTGHAVTPLIGACIVLGLARAATLTSDTGTARKAYQDLLTLWNEADPNLQPLKEATLEQSRLR